MLRIFDPIGVEYFFETKKYYRNAKDYNHKDTFAYIHNPGYQGRLDNVDVLINSHGFRGPEFKTKKPENTTRLLILGDSVVFGWGVDQDSIFPALLQKMLDREIEKVEVIPAGVGSWNTRTEYEYLKTEGIKFNPDVILLLVIYNDIWPKKTGRTEVSKERLFDEYDESNRGKALLETSWRKLVNNSFLAGYIQYYRTRLLAKKQSSVLNEDSPEWEDAKLGLKGIIEICNRHNIELVIYLYTNRDNIKSNKVFILYKNFLDSINIPYFFIPKEVIAPEFRNSVVDIHPNARGHKMIAQEMYKTLKPVLSDVTNYKNYPIW
jgi:lysophospholipase L1-like esterase